jgi:MoaA/NifB/PqqE/SkfB family radical SAM enzyme
MNDYSIPLNIDRAVIEINGGCNYTCQMCPQTNADGTHGGRGKDWLKKMSLEDFERAVAECAEAGLNVVNLEGSGEPTLNRNLPEYIAIVKKYGAKAFIYTNGYNLRGDFMKECVDAGLDLARFSIIGYNQAMYRKWMNRYAFDTVKQNAIDMKNYIKERNSNCIVASYHLILDNDQEEYEVSEYRKNFIDVVGSHAEIWKMHNWSGVYDPTYKRKGEKRTCGRPFSPDITIRAGGSNGTKLSVAPCCQVLGRDAEADLGSLENKSVEEVWNGDRYKWLRQMHTEKRFDEVSFCKDCDFLYEDNEVLVWKNNDLVDINKMKGTKFDLGDFK